MTKALKIESLLFVFAIVFYITIAAFNLSFLFYLIYVLLASLYFFPAKFLIFKNKITLEILLPSIVLCFTLTLSYVLHLVGRNNTATIVALILGIANIGYLVYFRTKRDDLYFVPHILANCLLATTYLP
ncbi:MAG: hypothetical protein LC109_00855 [Bacteroidia bacterium]|nr:hypothetical protein [Bacteroidia bacterium]MCO5253189.1 hypothetical protein [Bacteroidota bacterium]MCZ2128800.1 hypothetical protein [Bacteroidia bacterium]